MGAVRRCRGAREPPRGTLERAESGLKRPLPGAQASSENTCLTTTAASAAAAPSPNFTCTAHHRRDPARTPIQRTRSSQLNTHASRPSATSQARRTAQPTPVCDATPGSPSSVAQRRHAAPSASTAAPKAGTWAGPGADRLSSDLAPLVAATWSAAPGAAAPVTAGSKPSLLFPSSLALAEPAARLSRPPPSAPAAPLRFEPPLLADATSSLELSSDARLL